MFTIEISGHPKFPNIARKADMLGLLYDGQKKLITMDLRIRHYIDSTPFTEYDRTIQLVLNNTAKYPTGENDENGNPIEIGDYDFFVSQAEAGASLKDLVQGGVQQVDSTKIIDAKCNYRDVEEDGDPLT